MAIVVICGIYATVITVRSLLGWVNYFSGADRTANLMRQYLVVHLLRLRWDRFTKELLLIVFYLAVFLALLFSHELGDVLGE